MYKVTSKIQRAQEETEVVTKASDTARHAVERLGLEQCLGSTFLLGSSDLTKEAALSLSLAHAVMQSDVGLSWRCKHKASIVDARRGAKCAKYAQTVPHLVK